MHGGTEEDLQSGAALERKSETGIAAAFFGTMVSQIPASPTKVKANLQNMLDKCVNGNTVVANIRGMRDGIPTRRTDKYSHTGSFTNEDGIERMVIVSNYSSSGSWATYNPTASLSARIEPSATGTVLTIRHLTVDKALPPATLSWASGSASGCPDLTKAHALGAT